MFYPGLGESLHSAASSNQASQEMLQNLPPNSPPSGTVVGTHHQPKILFGKTQRSKIKSYQSPVPEERQHQHHQHQQQQHLVTAGNKSWLLRLFESKLFDASMAMAYLFNSKEPGVLGYIGNRLFTYSDTELDFYLPQMVNMYIMHHEVRRP